VLHSLAALAFVFSLSLLSAVGSPSIAIAQTSSQTAAELKQKAAQAGVHSEEEALRQARAAGMTREQILQALREAGYTETDVKGLLGDDLGVPQAPGAGSPAFTAPSALADSELTAPTMAPPPHATLRPEDYPEFTKEIAQRVPNSPAVLPFGYEIFGYVPSTFEPLAAGPVDPEYPIGPGDEVIVQVWGDNEFTHASVVSREATITIPDIGQVVLNGLTLAQAKRLITDRLATVYSGIRSHRPSTYVDVTLGKLRTIQVFILGGRDPAGRIHDLVRLDRAERALQRGRSDASGLHAGHPDHPPQRDLEACRPLRIHPVGEQGRGRPAPERRRRLHTAGRERPPRCSARSTGAPSMS
jgi:hypothetical protein